MRQEMYFLVRMKVESLSELDPQVLDEAFMVSLGLVFCNCMALSNVGEYYRKMKCTC